MGEIRPSHHYEAERRPLDHEVFDLGAGPVAFSMSDHELQIVVPGRDIESGWNVDCLVVDPETYDHATGKGYKGLRDGEAFILGREFEHDGRFDFSPYVSGRHLRVSRSGNRVRLLDLDSTNGTYLLVHNDDQRTTEEQIPTQHEPTPTPVLAEATRQKKLSIAGQSRAAEYRPSHNEDAFFVDEPNVSLGVFDGVGGISGSELASHTAADVVARELRSIPGATPLAVAKLTMKSALESAHEVIIKAAAGVGQVATTATVAKIFETRGGASYAVVASVGDSRAYLLRDGQLAHLTLDQAYRLPHHTDEDAKKIQETLANAIDTSKLDDEARQAFYQRNIITGALGIASNPPVVTLSDFQVYPGDKLLLSSDGVHDNLTDREIETITADHDRAEDIVEVLLTLAQSRSRDQNHIRSKADDMTAAALVL